MKPARYDMELYNGDSYLGPLMVLPDLSPFGGPSSLAGATVRAEIRPSHASTQAFPFSVEVVDPVARSFRLRLSPAQVEAVPGRAVWDLEVAQDAFVGTILAGSVTKTAQVTR